MRTILFLFLSLYISVSIAANSEEPQCETPEDAPEGVGSKVTKAQQSVVSLNFTVEGYADTRSTGFVFSESGYVIATSHSSNRLRERSGVVPNVTVYLADCSKQEGQFMYLRSAEDRKTSPDLAVIRIPNPPVGLSQGDVHALRAGDRLWGVAGSFTVAGSKRILSGRIEDLLYFIKPKQGVREGYPFIRISGRASKGVSGAPVVNNKGEVLGMTVLTGVNHSSNYATHITTIVRFLKHRELL